MILRTLTALAVLATIPALARATPVLIQEVYYDAIGPDSAAVFTELIGPPGASLDGWSLVGVNGSTGAPYRTVGLGGTIPLDGIFVIATATASVELALERDFTGSIDWQNGPDAVQLLDPLGHILDALQYGDAGEGNAGEGGPAEDVDAGFSLTRDEHGTDTDDNATDFRAAVPTPGRAMEVPIPQPTTPWLFLTGLAVLLHRRGR